MKDGTLADALERGEGVTYADYLERYGGWVEMYRSYFRGEMEEIVARHFEEMFFTTTRAFVFLLSRDARGIFTPTVSRALILEFSKDLFRRVVESMDEEELRETAIRLLSNKGKRGKQP